MHVVLTGGSGFIGKALHAELVSHDHRVTIIDWHPDELPTDDLKRPGVFESKMDAFVGHDSVDCVVHLAAQVGRIFGDDDVAHTINSNAIMTALVARYCGENHIRLAYTSTSEIYGDQGLNICTEYGEKWLPHNLYGLSKRWGEEVSKLYAPKGLVIFRPSMPYGPGVPPGRGRRALDNFLWQANYRKPIPVHIGAERSWCWIGDIVRAMRMVLEDTAHDDAWNIGRDDDPRTLESCARLACELMGAPTSLIELVEPPKNQTRVKRLSTEKIRNLGWKPEMEFVPGMVLLTQWISHFDRRGRYVP